MNELFKGHPRVHHYFSSTSTDQQQGEARAEAGKVTGLKFAIGTNVLNLVLVHRSKALCKYNSKSFLMSSCENSLNSFPLSVSGCENIFPSKLCALVVRVRKKRFNSYLLSSVGEYWRNHISYEDFSCTW